MGEEPHVQSEVGTCCLTEVGHDVGTESIITLTCSLQWKLTTYVKWTLSAATTPLLSQGFKAQFCALKLFTLTCGLVSFSKRT